MSNHPADEAPSMRRDPTCAECISFMPDGKDEQGRRRGPCRFRPELGRIREDFPYCHVFSVRQAYAHCVKIPLASKTRRSPGSPGRSAMRKEPTPKRKTLGQPTTGDTSGEITMDRNGLKQIFRELMVEETLFGYPEIGTRWEGGTLIIKPANEENQPKEIPLDAFFHKVVMVRDRLRVLEAKINGSEQLSEQEKVDLQSYISKCYGTLTTFNILFDDKSDHFKSK